MSDEITYGGVTKMGKAAAQRQIQRKREARVKLLDELIKEYQYNLDLVSQEDPDPFVNSLNRHSIPHYALVVEALKALAQADLERGV